MINAPSALDLVDALLVWSADGSAGNASRVASSLGTAAAATGARGVSVELQLADRSPLTVGWGSLAAGALTAGVLTDLVTADGAALPGRLWFDGAPSDPSIVRAVELAVGAAASRADLRLASKRLEALEAATLGISGMVSVDDALQRIVDRVRELLTADYAALGIVDDLGVIERFVTSGISAAERQDIGAPPVGRGLLGLIVRDDRSYRVDDIAHHPASSGFPANHPPMAAFLGVPIHVRGRSVGNFYLTNGPGGRTFSKADERLVETFAAHAGIAIENTRLNEQVRRIAVDDERERIGRDLHDGIIQSIYGISLSLEDVTHLVAQDPALAAARIDRAIDALNVTIRDLRNFIFGLRPEPRDQASLADGLTTLARELHVNALIESDLELTDASMDLEPQERAEVLHIVREALVNVARHSRAGRVRMQIESVDDGLLVTVADDGQGFALDDAGVGLHHGLDTMRARAQRLGGTLRVESVRGSGTSVILGVPHLASPVAEHDVGGVP